MSVNMLDSTSAGRAGPETPAAGHGIRGDIQGLRAVAVMMVLLYHAGLPFVPGGFAGVDVFFVISGYLITGLMVRELERQGRLSLRTFWARRAKRLLPATAVVLVAVAIGTVLILPQLRWAVTAGDIAGASVYLINWQLAASSLDYLAQDYAPSPVQHFWSLAVEEQFYLLWPLLIVLLAGLHRRFGWSLRRTLLAGVAALSLPSLIWSIHLGGEPAAYFVTTTRGWELGIGAALAVVAPRLPNMNRVVAQVCTWAGMLALVAVTFLLPDSLAWPSWYALVPTLATAAVIAGGPAAGAGGAVALLGLPVLRWIGDLSYSLYLWHWPLLVFATVYWETLSPIRGLLVVALSFLPAYLTYRLVESPVRQSRTLARCPNRALGLGAVCTLVGVLAAAVVWVAIPDTAVVADSERPGAMALLTNPGTAIANRRASSITPDPLQARDNLPDLYGRDCQSNYLEATVKPCVFGADSDARVVLVGDSRAAQWSPTLQAVAENENWQLTTITKAGCPLAAVDIVKGSEGTEEAYPSCAEWNRAVLDQLLAGPDRPDLVVTSAFSPYQAAVDGRPLYGEENDDALRDGFRSTWSMLNEAGIPVLVLRETPLMKGDVAECVSENRDDLLSCTTSGKRALTPAHILQPAAQGLHRSTVIDLTTTAICPVAHCPAVIGNVLVYRDHHHLTADYARSLTPFLSDEMSRLRGTRFAADGLSEILPKN